MQLFSEHANQNKSRQESMSHQSMGKINVDNDETSARHSFIFDSSPAHASADSPTAGSNIQTFLRHRASLYLHNHAADTALFYAERLLSEKDSLANRLLVSKCYKALAQYNRAYHVLQAMLREKQTEYQRFLEKRKHAANHANQSHALNISDKQPITPMNGQGIDPFTPISRVRGFEDNDASNIGFAFNTPITANVARSNDNDNTSSSDVDISHIAHIHNSQNIHSNNGSMGASHMSFMASPKRNPAAPQTPAEATLHEARYFCSLICFELARYDECEEFLMGKKWSDSRSVELRVPKGVFGVFLLARVFHRSSRFDLAIRYYRECLQLDSYHFGAIAALAELGKDPGLSKDSQPHEVLQAKHCVVPSAEDKDGGALVELDKIDLCAYRKLKALFVALSWGYFKLQMFHPQEALKYFTRLPKSHSTSAWVLNNIARCYYEMNDYSRVQFEIRSFYIWFQFDW